MFLVLFVAIIFQLTSILPTNATEYQYDDSNRLVKVIQANQEIQFIYDANGNLIQKTPFCCTEAQVAAGGCHTLTLKEDRTVWAWGNNYYGQLGDGTTTSNNSPVQVTGLTGVKAVAAGMLHSVALNEDGTVWAWGENYYGQLGDGTTVNETSPVQVAGLTGVKAVATGDYHTLALKEDGRNSYLPKPRRMKI